MESVKKLETTLEKYYKDVPHLPKDIAKLIADWAWVATLIGVVLGVFGIFAAVSAILVAQSLVGVAGMYGGAGYVAQASTGLWLSAGISILFSILLIAIEAMAITPLKAHQQKGWDLIFLGLVVSAVSSVVSFLASFVYSGPSAVMGIFGLAVTFVALAIGAYIMFEVKSYFNPKKLATHQKKRS